MSCAHGGMQSRHLCVSTDTPKSTVERRCDISTPCATSTKAAQLHLPLSSSREAPPGVTIQDTEVGIKAGKKRRKPHHQEDTIDDDSGINEQAGSAIAEHAVGNSKRKA
jgi:hypothetical protein